MTDTLRENRRLHHDRRETPTRPLSRYSLHGRRRHNRRHDDQAPGYYVDRYPAAWIAATVSLMILGCIDGWVTLYLMRHGAREANPLMAILLNRSAGLFLAVKLAVTGAATLVMVSHYRINILRGLQGGRLLLIGLVLYAVLVGREFLALA